MFISLSLVLFGCKSNHITEEQRFEKSIRKQLPFRVDTVHWLSGTDVPTFKFSNGGYTAAESRGDACIDYVYFRPLFLYFLTLKCTMIQNKIVTLQSKY